MNYFKTVFTSIILFLFFVQPTFAARYYVKTDTQTFTSKGFFQLDVYLDSIDEVINAFDGEIGLPKELVSIIDIRTGGSYVSFWVEPPKQLSNNSIRFAGIFPGGYEGNKAFLFSLIGQIKDDTSRKQSASPFLGKITMENMHVLLHDGLGTPADVNYVPFNFTITSIASNDDNRQVLQANDTEPPEIFIPILTQDPNLNNGQKTIVFSTQDKGVGVSHYELYESDTQVDPKNTNEELEWSQVVSPHLLQDQTLSKNIYIKAVDKVGNERIVQLPAQHPLGHYSEKAIWGIILTVLIVLAVLLLVLWQHAHLYKIPKKQE